MRCAILQMQRFVAVKVLLTPRTTKKQKEAVPVPVPVPGRYLDSGTYIHETECVFRFLLPVRCVVRETSGLIV